MRNIAQQRCFNHATREAAARCPECKRFFCRECVTEHEDRVLCAGCLGNRVKAQLPVRRTLTGLIRFAQGVFSILVLWFFFFVIGEVLCRIPDTFHETDVWLSPWIDSAE